MKPTLSIVIPVYNEAESIKTALEQLNKAITTDCTIVLVYDSENDTTLTPAKACNFDNVVLIKNKYGRGALNAIKTGLESAQTEAILVTMADLSDDPLTINQMIQVFEQGADIVCGSRYMKGGAQKGGPWLKSFLSQFSCLFLYYTTTLPTHDVTNSFKLYRKSVIDSITIESSGGFELGMELTIKAFLQGYTIAEVPTVWHDRQAGESNFKLYEWIPHYIDWAWTLFIQKNLLVATAKQGLQWITQK